MTHQLCGRHNYRGFGCSTEQRGSPLYNQEELARDMINIRHAHQPDSAMTVFRVPAPTLAMSHRPPGRSSNTGRECLSHACLLSTTRLLYDCLTPLARPCSGPGLVKGVGRALGPPAVYAHALPACPHLRPYGCGSSPLNGPHMTRQGLRHTPCTLTI
jgi:hypothetical protein